MRLQSFALTKILRINKGVYTTEQTMVHEVFPMDKFPLMFKMPFLALFYDDGIGGKEITIKLESESEIRFKKWETTIDVTSSFVIQSRFIYVSDQLSFKFYTPGYYDIIIETPEHTPFIYKLWVRESTQNR